MMKEKGAHRSPEKHFSKRHFPKTIFHKKNSRKKENVEKDQAEEKMAEVIKENQTQEVPEALQVYLILHILHLLLTQFYLLY